MEDDFTLLSANLRGELLDPILRTVTLEGTEWSISPQGVRTCPRIALSPPAKVWYHFIRTRLTPTSHDHTVSQERVLLLHCILTGKSVNIGKFIHREIDSCASKVKGKLYFPSTITSLCVQHSVPYEDDEATTKNVGIINALTIARLTQDAGFFQPHQPQPSPEREEPAADPAPAPPPDPAAASSSAPPPADLTLTLDLLAANQKHMMSMLQHMEEQQHAYWKYARVRDNNLKLALQRNFTKPYPPLPPFPEDIFHPWQPEQEPETEEED